jgi:cytochrome d ubiquinol oxidase subunit I
MVSIGLFLIALFATAYLSARQQFERHRWFLRVALFSLPLPGLRPNLAGSSPVGRQPGRSTGLLRPSFLGVSATPRTNVLLSLTGFAIFYSALAAVDVFLLLRMIRRGPDGLGYWPPPSAAAASH